jgi:hypothetical protein
MIVIYRCLHCGAQTKGRIDTALTKGAVLNDAYTRTDMDPKAYIPHKCDLATISVAQLIAVRDE